MLVHVTRHAFLNNLRNNLYFLTTFLMQLVLLYLLNAHMHAFDNGMNWDED